MLRPLLLFAVFACTVSSLWADPPADVENTGRCEFDDLPNRTAPFWNIDNLEYPADAIGIEAIDKTNRGLRIGRPDGTQPGRYTMTLRSSTHDWDPVEIGVTQSVTVRLAARYTGTVMIAVSIPGAGALLNLGAGRCVVWQRSGETDEQRDESPLVKQKLPGWQAENMHSYTLEWMPTGRDHDLPCRLLIDGQVIKEFRGHRRPAPFDSTFEISFENGTGTGLVDSVEWKINGGRPKPALQFIVQPRVRQLFLDDFGIERLNNIQRVVHQPVRHEGNPVLRGDNPWEKASASVYGTMLYDEESRKFRLWYLCTADPPASGRKWLEVGGSRRVTNCTLLAYAESDDAVHWSKPDLGQLSWEGSKKNNLIDIGIDNPEGVGVLHDKNDPDPTRRYKAFFWDRRLPPPDDATGVDIELAKVPVDPPGLTDAMRAGGMWVAFSPDGLHWKTQGPVLPQGSDTTHTILFDPVRRKYLGFGRMGFGRTVALSESDDAVTWSDPRRVLACDTADGPGGQIYGMPTDLYEGLLVGMFWMYREGTDAKIDTQLAVSRNGRRWTRVANRQTFLANGPEGAWDDGMSRVGRGINVVGDKIYLHYSMVNGPHRSAKFPRVERKYPGAIGLVTLRRDGFVSLAADVSGGSVHTRPFEAPPGALHINVSALKGSVKVEALTAAGDVLSSAEISGRDQGDLELADFRLPADLPPDAAISLRFTLRQAHLYSYWFE